MKYITVESDSRWIQKRIFDIPDGSFVVEGLFFVEELTVKMDRAKKPLDMRSENLTSYPPFYFQNGGRQIKIKRVIVMAVMPLSQ